MKTFASIVVLLLVGAILGFTISYSVSGGTICFAHTTYINKQVECGPRPAIKKTDYASLASDISDYLNGEEAAGRVTTTSLYFRDLERGPIFGINELATYSPASLLKLPLAAAFFKEEEERGGVLTMPLTFTQYPDIAPGYIGLSPPLPLLEGEAYPIREYLRYMLSYSDNQAFALLVQFFFETWGGAEFEEIFHELGLLAPHDSLEENLSTRAYGSVFRSLYNASYLSPASSELILSWLAESTFTDGLAAGVPQGVQVAHKFGERDVEDGSRQLHDCGIIYFPENPYLLCIMTLGKDVEELARVIATISRMVYEEVDSRKL